MNYIKLAVGIVLIFGLSSLHVNGQNAIPASGGNASGSGGSASYSIGKIAYSTNSGAGGTVSEGVQQPFEIYIITAIDLANDISLSFSAYPNPTTDFVTLGIDNIDFTNYSYQLYNINGQLLENKMLAGEETTIAMQNLVPSSYILKVFGNQKEFKTFKIIKR